MIRSVQDRVREKRISDVSCALVVGLWLFLLSFLYLILNIFKISIHFILSPFLPDTYALSVSGLFSLISS